jgi:hypothetical protein
MLVRARKEPAHGITSNSDSVLYNNPTDNNADAKKGKKHVQGSVRWGRLLGVLVLLAVLIRVCAGVGYQWYAGKEIGHSPLAGRVPAVGVVDKVFEDVRAEPVQGQGEGQQGIARNFARWKRVDKSLDQVKENELVLEELMREIGNGQVKEDFARWKREKHSVEEEQMHKEELEELMKEIGSVEKNVEVKNEEQAVKQEDIIGRPVEKGESENELDELMSELDATDSNGKLNSIFVLF